MIFIDGGTVKHWSSTQATIASEVGEAEYYRLVRAATEGLAMAPLGRDLGYELSLRIWVDRTTAKAIVTPLGLGIRCATWRSSSCGLRKLFDDFFDIRKVAGERNPADVLTKAMSMVEMKEKVESIGGLLTPAEISRIHDDVGASVQKIRWEDTSDDD